MKIGDFSLQIISAENETTFKEHVSSDGEATYAEVEPDVEYFVEVSSNAMSSVYVDLAIDGQTVETAKELQTGETKRVGVWQRGPDDRQLIQQRAFKFDKATVHARLSLPKPPKFWTGVITAEFYGDPQLVGERYHLARTPAVASRSAISSCDSSSSSDQTPAKTSTQAGSMMAKPNIIYKPKENVVHLWQSGDVGFCEGVSLEGKKNKGVKTVHGKSIMSEFRSKPECHKLQETPKKKAKRKSPPSKCVVREVPPVVLEVPFPNLQTISLHYCSAVGLIHAKILPEPPDWGYIKLRNKKPRTYNWKEECDKLFTKKQTTLTDAEGNIIEENQYDFCDLTSEENEMLLENILFDP